MKKIRFIINPISGINRNPQKILRWISTIFEDAGEKPDIVFTRQRGHANELAREAVEKEFDIVVAVGGDGTINEIGSALTGTPVAMGIIPAGSGNGFARNVDIPLDQKEAVRLLLDPEIRIIDVGKINEYFFFNVAGTGLDAEVSQNFEEFGVRGPLPYFLVGTRSYFQFHPEPLKIETDHEILEVTPLIVSIANGAQYGNGAIIAPNAKPDDGLLDVCILDSIPIWKAVPNIYRLFNGTIDQIEEFRVFQTRKLVIHRSGAGTIHTDGDPRKAGAELRIEVVPASLRVAVPRKD